MFDLVVSRPLSVPEVEAAVAGLVPPGCRVAVRPDVEDLPSDGDVRVVVWPPEGVRWPQLIAVLTGDEHLPGPYPDLRLAERLAQRYEVDVFGDVHPFVGGLDPHDPYWSPALLGGRWWLVSTVRTRLVSGDDGVDGDVVRVRPVTVPGWGGG